MRLIAVLLLSQLLFSQEYVIDEQHSSVGFSIKHLSVTDVVGFFTIFNGKISISDGRITDLEGNVSIESIITFNNDRDHHLISDNEFFSKHYAHLSLTESSRDKIKANLIINNIKKEQEFSVKIIGPIRSPDLPDKEEPKNPLIQTNINKENTLISKDNKQDCGCYATYGENVVGVELRGRINRFDYNIANSTPDKLLGKYVDIVIRLEASN